MLGDAAGTPGCTLAAVAAAGPVDVLATVDAAVFSGGTAGGVAVGTTGPEVLAAVPAAAAAGFSGPGAAPTVAFPAGLELGLGLGLGKLVPTLELLPGPDWGANIDALAAAAAPAGAVLFAFGL